MGKTYSSEEIKILKMDIGIKEKQGLLCGRSYNSIISKSKRMGIKISKSLLTISKSGLDKKEIEKILENKLFHEIINGCLLSDANVDNRRFCLTNIQKEWLLHVKRDLDKIFNRNFKVHNIKKPDLPVFIEGRMIEAKQAYYLQCCCTFIFSILRKKWYISGKKIIPNNLELTPLTCYHWYLGDGNLACSNKKLYKFNIYLHTQGFSFKDVEKLKDGLEKKIIGIKAKIYKNKKNQPIICLIGKNALLFLNYLPKNHIKSFNYKFNIKGYSCFNSICRKCNAEFNYYGFAKNKRVNCDSCVEVYKNRKTCSWTEGEINIISSKYLQYSDKEIKNIFLPDRSISSIYHKRLRMGIKRAYENNYRK